MKSLLPLLGLSSLLALGSGCSKHERPAATPASTPPATTTTAAPAAPRAAVERAVEQNQGGGLNISAEIRQLCPGIPAPKFGYDSADLRNEWAEALDKLAQCMKSGGLAGRNVLLTGHTDPRGDDDYNMALGGRRAESVKDAVSAYGVMGSRLQVTSRGETDAVGTDESTWATDRRVDIDLLKKPAQGATTDAQ